MKCQLGPCAQRLGFVPPLLDVVLAEVGEPECLSLAHVRRRPRLGDGDQRDLVRRPRPDGLAGGRDAPLQAGEAPRHRASGRHDARVDQGVEHGRERQADHRVVGALDSAHERAGAALDAIGTGLVGGLPRGDIGVDLGVAERSKRHPRHVETEPGRVLAARQGERRDDLVRAPGEAAQHRRGLRRIRRFAEDRPVEGDDRVAAQHERPPGRPGSGPHRRRAPSPARSDRRSRPGPRLGAGTSGRSVAPHADRHARCGEHHAPPWRRRGEHERGYERPPAAEESSS